MENVLSLRDRSARLKLLLFDSASDTVEFAQHITLTNAHFRFISNDQLQEVGLDPGPILVEPKAKNTAAAILAANISACSGCLTCSPLRSPNS